MRIIHVIDDLSEQAGGPAQACIEMARSVAARGHHVAIYTFGDRRPAWLTQSASLPFSCRHQGVDVHLSPGRSTSWTSISPRFYAALLRAIPTADLVHVHVLYGFHLWAAWRICRQHGIPLVVRPCGILNAYTSSVQAFGARLYEMAFQRRLLRQATLMHYTTDQEADDASTYVQNPSRAVVPLGVNVAAYERLPPRATFDSVYPEAAGRKIVLYFGRLHRKKRLDLVIGATAAARNNGHDVHLIIAGSDDGVEAECRALVGELGLGERVTFTGLLVNHAKRLVFGGADVFVLPSMTENFGIAVAEAAASGIPLLISEHVNIAPSFAERDAAIIVQTHLGSVVEGLERLLQDQVAATAMARRAKQVVEDKFTWDRIATDLVAMYQSTARRIEAADIEAPDGVGALGRSRAR